MAGIGDSPLQSPADFFRTSLSRVADLVSRRTLGEVVVICDSHFTTGEGWRPYPAAGATPAQT